MWRKNIRFMHSLQLSRHIRSVKHENIIISSTSRCCCMEHCMGPQLHTSSNTSQNHYQNEASQRSRSHVAAVLTALGVSFTSYKLWNERRKLYAAENSSRSDKSTSANSSQADSDRNSLSDDHGETRGSTADRGAESGMFPNAKSSSNDEIDWSLFPDIPSHVPYLLIGSGIASIEAYKAIKTKDIRAKVLVIGEEDFFPYWRPPLSKHFWFDDNVDAYKEYQYTNLRGKKSTVFLLEGIYMEPKKLPFSDRGGLALLKNTKVVQLDSVNKKVVLDNGAEISFDKCLIATGGRPKNDEVLEKAGEDVKKRTTLFRNYSDLWRLSEVCKSVKSVAVVGGGFLGSELAVGINYKGDLSGMKVYQLFPENGNMAKVLPDFLSQWTTSKMREDGINVKTNVSVKSAVYEDGKVKLGLSNGEYLKVDHIVVAVGIEPNTELATSGNLELDDKIGGFRVNTELQARTDIWAAGDCASFYDPKLGRRRVEHFDHAAITGRLAGFNMTGENRPYIHQSMFWSTLGNIVDYEAVGLVDSRLQTCSFFRKAYPKEDSSKADNSTSKELQGATESVKSSSTSAPQKSQSTTAAISSDKSLENKQLQDDYKHGVIFYLRDGEVVGIVLWNLSGFMGEPSRLDIARQVIADGAKGKDLTEVAKLFNIYAD